MSPFDVFIFLSSEDDQYRVSGGIGTYLGVLTSTLKDVYPHAQVYWLTRSPHEEDFTEVDAAGVVRHYLAPMPTQYAGFLDSYPFIQQDPAAQLIGLHHRMENLVMKILTAHPNQRILIESGEWEGHGNGLFRCLRDPRIFKVARIHTPLATCMKQNNLPLNSANAIQMLCEFQTVIAADVISSCTEFMKNRLLTEVFHHIAPPHIPVVVLPNPVDIKRFDSMSSSRSIAIDFLESLFPGKISETDFLIFLVGSVEKRKGVELALQAIPQVVDAIPNAHFCFIGHHADRKGHSLTANQKYHPDDLYSLLEPRYHKRVSFLGYVSHEILPRILPAGDLFPILSLGDNFPGTVAEIALAKRPILSVQRGGVEEMLTDELGAFVAYPLGSQLEEVPQRLVQGILTLYQNPGMQQSIADQVYDTIRYKYAPHKIVKEMISTYANLYASRFSEK